MIGREDPISIAPTPLHVSPYRMRTNHLPGGHVRLARLGSQKDGAGRQGPAYRTSRGATGVLPTLFLA